MALPYTLGQLQARLTPVFSRNSVRCATLFGSYSQGNATAQSDVDLLVDSGLHGLQFLVCWKTSVRLWNAKSILSM